MGYRADPGPRQSEVTGAINPAALFEKTYATKLKKRKMSRFLGY